MLYVRSVFLSEIPIHRIVSHADASYGQKKLFERPRLTRIHPSSTGANYLVPAEISYKYNTYLFLIISDVRK